MRLNTRVPAKVNLSLLVGSRRTDGYHELLSVLVPIDLFDSMDFELVARPAEGGAGTLQVDCEAAPGESNLAARALRLLEKATGWALDGRIGISKGIPVGAGLGGGSSDAAAALRVGAQAIVAAGGPSLAGDRLRTLACQVGADVPFFLQPEPASARGVGDVLEPLELPPIPLALVFWGEQLSTAAVYEEFDRLTGSGPGVLVEGVALEGARGFVTAVSDFERRTEKLEAGWRALSEEWRGGRLESGQVLSGLKDLLENDLEDASFRLLPGLERGKDALLAEGALGAVMSGSGPTLVGLSRTQAEAAELARRLSLRGYDARSVQGGGLP